MQTRLMALLLLLACGRAALHADGVQGQIYSQGQQWLTLVNGVNGAISGARADVAVSPGERVLVAWINQTAFSSEIWYAVIEPDGRFTVSPAPLPGVIGNPRQVRVAASGGAFMITWAGPAPATPSSPATDVWYQVLDLAGQPLLAAPARANTWLSGWETLPDCAGRVDGGFVLGWVRGGPSFGAATQGIWARRFDDAGTPLDPAEVRCDDPATAGGFQRGLSVAVWPGGAALVVWQDGLEGALPGGSSSPDGHGSAILARWLQPSLAPLGSTNTLVNSNVAGDQREPVVAASWTDLCVIAWSGPGVQGASDVWYRRFDALGVPQEAGDQLVTGAFNQGAVPAGQFATAAGMNASGEFAIAWSEGGGYGGCSVASGTPARVARYTLQGGLIETFEAQPAGSGGVTQGRAGMALDQYGNVLLAWEACLPAPNQGIVDLRFRRFKRQMITFNPVTVGGVTELHLTLDSPSDPLHVYIVATSLVTVPNTTISVGYRTLKLGPDLIFSLSFPNPLPGVFAGFFDQLDASGVSTIPQVNLPNLPFLSGTTLHFAFVAGLNTIVTVSDTYSWTL